MAMSCCWSWFPGHTTRGAICDDSKKSQTPSTRAPHGVSETGNSPSSRPSDKGPFSPGGTKPGGADAYYTGNFAGEASTAALNCIGYATRHALTESNKGLVLVLVGLPGRGKSFISRKLEGFLKWEGRRTATFNAGKYRREAEEAVESGRADFFDPSNSAAMVVRKQAAESCLHDLLDFLDSGGQAGIFDATNSTAERRRMIVEETARRDSRYDVIFIEVLCDDPEVLATNFRNKVLNSPDFANMTLEEGIADLQARVKMYEDRYETIEDDSMSYIKLYNMSSKVLVNRIYGNATKRLLPYLMGTHIGTRPIWLARTAQVPHERHQDSDLSEEGLMFAQRLSAFMKRRLKEYYHGSELPSRPMRVISSTVNSCVQTTEALLDASEDWHSQVFTQTSALNPLDRGRLGGPWWIDKCTEKPPWEELKKIDKKFYKRWEADRLNARFPGGESYADVVARVESALFDMESSTKPVLTVAHMTAIQVLLSYFQGTPIADAWDVSVPEHYIFEILPTLGGTYTVEVINVDNEPVEEWMAIDKLSGSF
eukprot:CAMPEP_0206434136 /NCGR_PEP_ID=MMETSP0324_2-20121206/8967_1 /ASSEMBLY_ACC=CAM_ASM_000836 /TAXON_ID=2866 /ORGANISM="Crypthecodinium cohnii, Strain Seligo" /LENGTH=540 /DNA_ID=CAMNT_0053900571 /DNA_START=70 /DNA_END=1692 /DNA_ORIENTATION=-